MISFITGESISLEEDFRLNGPIPLEWARQYRTQVEVNGLLGKTWHTFADQTLQFKRSEGAFVWINGNGNEVGLPYLEIGDEAVIATEKIKYAHNEDEVLIEDYDQKLNYHYKYVGGSKDTYRIARISRHRFEILFLYNASGRLEKIIDSSNRTLDLERDNEQRIISVTHVSDVQADKLLVEYEYNEEGFLSIIRDTLGQEEKLEYTNGLLTLKTDRNGDTEHWEFENKKIEDDPKCLKHWFNKNGQQLRSFEYKLGKTVVTNAMGAKTTHWHRNGEIIQVTDAMGNSESWEYNLNGMVMRYTDKLGQHTYYGYDDYGNKTSERLPNGGSTNFIYENNNLVAAKNATGALWLWEYDENGFLTRRIGPSNDATRYYYTNDLLTQITDTNGLETYLSYNKEHTLEKVTLPNGEVTNWKYDGQGQLLHAVSNQDTSVNYHYDELGRVKQMKTVDGNMVHLKYDGVGNVIQAKDKHHQVKFEYSATGKLESREENDTKIKFAYTKADELKAITNEHNSLYRFDRDRNGQIIQESGFDGLKRKYARNAGGQVSQTTTPDGKNVRYTYDLLGNVSIVHYDDQTQEVYTYNKAGLLIEAVNENGVVTLERDDLGRVVAETQNGVRIENEYNRLGQRTSLTSNLGADIKISRDKFGHILNTTAEQQVGEKTNRWEVDITRNLVGLEIERSLPGGVSSNWERDKSGRPIKHSVSAKEQIQTKRRYKWDVNDRLKSIEDLLKNELTTFEHDLFGNLSAASYADGSWDYKLPDEIGNLFKTKEKKDRKYGKAGQLLKDEKYSYSYDEVGNLIEKSSIAETWKYKWTQGGMLKTVVRPDKRKVNFTYDALGRRLTKTYQDQTTHFVWDGNVPLHEWTSSTEESNSTINEKGETEHKTPENLTTWIFEDGTFIPMAKLQGEKSYSIITDHLGTPTEAYDEEGEKVWSRQLNIYGEKRKETGFENFIPFLYQGQYLDTETELAYNRFRYYDSSAGVYISRDPVGLAGGMPNMYSYTVDTNTLLDPFGTEQITFRAAFNQAKRDLGIPKNVNTPKPVKVWDSAFENRHVWAFEGEHKGKFIVMHSEDKFGRGLHLHTATSHPDYVDPTQPGKYNQHDGHIPENKKGFKGKPKGCN